jgi:hypothetical protein
MEEVNLRQKSFMRFAPEFFWLISKNVKKEKKINGKSFYFEQLKSNLTAPWAVF